MKNEIQHQLFFPHPPKTVWEYLTNAELMKQWLMPNDFQPVVGRSFQFKVKPVPALDFDGIVQCTVLEIVPFQKLSYSWKSGNLNGDVTIDSLVVWTLTAKENGTELVLRHSGFTDADNLPIFSAMKQGWLTNMQKIGELIKTKTYGTTQA